MRSEALGASSSAAYASQHRGAGGKIRRPNFRKTPSTPYDRPLTQQRRPAAASGGWMSKIVNPAYRLLAGGAARFLPSVFSSSSTPSLLAPPPTDAAEEEDGKYTEPEQETRYENQESSIDLYVSESTADEGPSEQAVRPDISNSSKVGRGRSQHLAGDTDGADLSHIEQLIKGKTFCREDIDRLMGIIQARVVDAEGGGHILNVSTTGKDDKVEIPLRNPMSTNEEKEEDVEEDRLATLTPLLQPMVKEEIGASPVELAKAYMGSRASEFDFGSKSLVSQNDRLLSHTNELPSNRFLPPSSPQPSICWPGAIVQEQHGFSTPRSQQGRYGTSSHSRTPYSRVYSRSKSKLAPLEGTNRRISDISATPFQKQTPYYGENSGPPLFLVNRMTSSVEAFALKVDLSRIRASGATEDVQGSVGPIRRLRSKFISETPRRGSPSVWSSQKGSPQVKESFLGDNPLSTKSFEPTAINPSFQSTEQKGLSEADTSIVHPHTSKLARLILEQISRTPTRKEKSEELKLVIGKNKPLTSEVSGTTNDAATTSYVGGSLPNKERESPFFKVPSANIRTGGIDGTDSDSTSASKTLQKSSFSIGNITPSTTNQDSTQANEMPHLKKGPIAANSLPSVGVHALKAPKAPKAPTTSGTKPVLPPIFVDKSNHRVRFTPDNSTSGFTFPITAPSSSSEPPTPSMMPFSLATDVNPPRDDAKPPTYTFGEKKSAAPLVFSFPSTSNASTLNDAPVFKFGSEGGRVSFSSVGKDAVCC